MLDTWSCCYTCWTLRHIRWARRGPLHHAAGRAQWTGKGMDKATQTLPLLQAATQNGCLPGEELSKPQIDVQNRIYIDVM